MLPQSEQDKAHEPEEREASQKDLDPERQIQALLALHKTSLSLHEQFDLAKLLQRVTEQGAQLLGTTGGGLFLYDERACELELVVTYNLVPDSRGMRMALGEGLVGRVAQSLQPLFVTDYPHWSGHSPHFRSAMQSALAVPFLWRGKLVGVLGVFERERQRTFSEADIRLLQLFADQAAAAISNAQLYQTLTESEARYRSLVEAALVAVYLVRDGKVLYVNQRGCEISGYSREELTGRRVLDFIVPEDRERALSILQGQDDKPRHSLTQIVRKDGRVIEVEFQSQWIELERQKTLIGTVVDITPQHEIARLRQRLSQIGRDILSTSDPRKILKEVVEAIVAHSPFKAAGIAIYDRPTDPSEVDGYRIRDVFAAGLTIQERDSLSQRALSGGFLPHHKILAKGRKIGHASYYVSAQDLPEIVESSIPMQDPGSCWGPYDTLFVFLYYEGRLLGRIGVARPIHGQLPTPEELEPLELLANMAVLALEKAQRLSALQAAHDQAQYVNRFLRAINEARGLEELFSTVIHRGLELIPKADGGSILLRQERENVFEFRASVGRDLARLQSIKLPVEETIRALRLDQGPQILTRSLQQQDDLWRTLTKDLGEPPASTITLPITQGGKIVGVLNFNNFHEEGVFSEADLKSMNRLLPEVELALTRAQDHEQLREQALRDPLTGVYNRRYFNELVSRELERARRYGHPFAFLMVDFDNFFAINDRFGHLMGDRVLREIAQLLSQNVRALDTVVRYGGDEFLIVLAETDRSEAGRVVHRLEEQVALWLKEFQRQRGKLKLSVSIGVASWAPSGKKGIDDVLDEADKFMYRRKRSKQKGSRPKARTRSRI